MGKSIDITGQKFGKWTIISQQGKDHRGNVLWLRRCECGAESTTIASNVKNGSSLQCPKCAAKALSIDRYKEAFPEAMWNKVVLQAERRGINIEISKREAHQLLCDQKYSCALSGLPIRIALSPLEYRELKQTASLDRIDSSKGYTQGNLQWVHKTINLMKNTINNAEFIELCTKIASHNV